MSAPVPIEAIKCQLRAIINVALDNDALRLPVRAAFRDGLQLLERPNARHVLSLPRDRRAEHSGRQP
jgi:hypothetical protein